MFPPQSARVVYFNPPYHKVHSGRINPDGEKALARHEIQGTLDDFMAAARYLLKDSGYLFLIYPAVRFVELMHRMRLNGLEPKRVRMVHSQRSSRGAFALVEGIKGGGEELEVLAPLFIYGEGGGYTDDMRGIFNEIRGPLPSCGE
jgi:tRNA1Val (adenine37-N6)-methyltransferase